MDTVEIFAKLKSNPLQSGITFSGGEPFAQPAPLIGLAKLAHSAGYDVWSYTGYTYEELRDHEDKNVRELLNEVDVLVDGEYIEGERDLSLAFRGSRNQRVIDMNATRRTGRIVILPI